MTNKLSPLNPPLSALRVGDGDTGRIDYLGRAEPSPNKALTRYGRESEGENARNNYRVKGGEESIVSRDPYLSLLH